MPTLEEGKDQKQIEVLEKGLQLLEDKLRDLEENFENFSIVKSNPFSYWSQTIHPDGRVEIHGKTEEEAEFIKERTLYNPNISFMRSKTPLELMKEHEEKQRE